MSQGEKKDMYNSQDPDNPEKLASQGTQDEERQNKNTTQYVLDTTIWKQTQIT